MATLQAEVDRRARRVMGVIDDTATVFVEPIDGKWDMVRVMVSGGSLDFFVEDTFEIRNFFRLLGLVTL